MTFSIGANRYKAGKLNAFDQLRVLKRLAVPMSKLLTGDLMARITQDVRNKSTDNTLAYFSIFAEAAGAISDADLEYIIVTCCAKCEREQQSVWAPIYVNQTFMYQDISNDATALLRITFETVKENLSGFFDALPSTLGLGEVEKTTSTS